MLVVVTSLAAMTPQAAKATSGSFTINPGETRYVSFGNTAVDDLLLWQFTVDTMSTVFTDWLQAPDGTHLGISSTTWGRIVDMAGEWKLGFSIDASGFWSATVTYSIYNVQPSIEIASPSNGAYVNLTTVVVSGTVDGMADTVKVSTDDVHYEAADLYGGAWNKQVSLAGDGTYTVYAEETIIWGSYWAKYYDSVTLTLDTLLPELLILYPQQDSYVLGDYGMSWQSSDNHGVASTEVKIDALGWQTVSANGLPVELSDGPHVLQVRVTDVAGNAVVGTVSFVADSSVPQVSITGPEMNSKISKDNVVVTWTGSDSVSGIDHYEVQVAGGQWVDVGNATSYQLTNLDDVWHSVNVKAVDRSGNTATSTVGFGIYTSIWSQNGPYHGIPLYALIVGIIIVALLGYILIQRRMKQPEPPSAKAP
jgi:hypothetical protein